MSSDSAACRKEHDDPLLRQDNLYQDHVVTDAQMTKESIGAVDTDKQDSLTNNKESANHATVVVSSTNKNHDDEDASEKEQVGRFSQSTKRSSLSGKQARFLTPKAKSWKAGKTHESSADLSTADTPGAVLISQVETFDATRESHCSRAS